MTKRRGLVIPVVAGILSLILFLVASTGISYYSIAQNNFSQQRVEQTAISRAVSIAITQQNKTLCEIIVPVNEASKNSSHVNHQDNSYSKKLEKAFADADRKFRCG